MKIAWAFVCVVLAATIGSASTPARADPKNLRAYCALHKTYAGPGEESEDEVPREVKAAHASEWRCAGGKVMVCDAGASGRACLRTSKPDARQLQAFRDFCGRAPNMDIPYALNTGTGQEWTCKGAVPTLTKQYPIDRLGYLKHGWRPLN